MDQCNRFMLLATYLVQDGGGLPPAAGELDEERKAYRLIREATEDSLYIRRENDG